MKRRRKWQGPLALVGAIAALSCLSAFPAVAQDARLEQCQALKDKIDRYTSLRRKGGSASQMDTWKKQLRRVERQFREKDCSDYRRELR